MPFVRQPVRLQDRLESLEHLPARSAPRPHLAQDLIALHGEATQLEAHLFGDEGADQVLELGGDPGWRAWPGWGRVRIVSHVVVSLGRQPGPGQFTLRRGHLVG
jgi:hypothetical protein